MPLKEHLDNTLKFDPAPTPIPRMVLCSLCTTLPLLLGYALNQLPLAIFGSLTGFALCLNDHFGPLKKRISHLIITYLFLSSSFLLGAYLSTNTILVAISLFLISFILGKTKEHGVELERILLFSALQLLAASGTEGILKHFPAIFLYFTFALLNYIVCLTLVYLFSKHRIEFFASKRQTFKKIINHQDSTRFAFIFSLTTTAGFLIANYLHISRGYWVVGTTLIVMLPDSKKSYYKSAQRLLGTIGGVLIGAFLIQFGHDPISLMIFCLIAAYFAPLGLIRNYWLGNIFIAALVLFLLEISKTQYVPSSELAILRVTDIALGCGLGVIGTLVNTPSALLKSLSKNFEN